MTWYTYLVRCADDSLYCGITNDIERRINEHNGDRKKASAYCWSRRPVKLVWFSVCFDRSEAARCEHRVKNKSREQKEEMISRWDSKLSMRLSDLSP